MRVRFVLDTCTAADAGGGRERQAGEETWIDERGREGGRAAEEKHRNSEIVSAEKKRGRVLLRSERLRCGSTVSVLLLIHVQYPTP